MFLQKKTKKNSKYFFNQKNITPMSQEAGNMLQMGPIRKTAPVSIRWRVPSGGRLRWSFFLLKPLSQFVSLDFFVIFVLLMSRFRYSSSCALFGTEETPEQLRLADTVRPIAETRSATNCRDERCD
jgi:hypothetical protein